MSIFELRFILKKVILFILTFPFNIFTYNLFYIIFSFILSTKFLKIILSRFEIFGLDICVL